MSQESPEDAVARLERELELARREVQRLKNARYKPGDVVLIKTFILSYKDRYEEYAVEIPGYPYVKEENMQPSHGGPTVEMQPIAADEKLTNGEILYAKVKIDDLMPNIGNVSVRGGNLNRIILQRSDLYRIIE